jgi:hypothetical protein
MVRREHASDTDDVLANNHFCLPHATKRVQASPAHKREATLLVRSPKLLLTASAGPSETNHW